MKLYQKAIAGKGFCNITTHSIQKPSFYIYTIFQRLIFVLEMVNLSLFRRILFLVCLFQPWSKNYIYWCRW